MEDTSYSVLKKEVENPTGQTVGKWQEVVLRVQKEGSNNVRHSGVIGKNDFNPNLEQILIQMREGQKWVIQDTQKASFTIQVVSVGKIVDNISHQERADVLKGQGNTFIKARQNGKAIQKYLQAYNLLINDPSSKSQELKLSIISNLALATLNQSDFKSSVDWCDKHLQDTVEPNVKIVYRRASANKGLRNWEQARRDIHFGIENSKGDDESISNFNKLQNQLEKQEKEQKAKEKAVYGKMFN